MQRLACWIVSAGDKKARNFTRDVVEGLLEPLAPWVPAFAEADIHSLSRALPTVGDD
jgi:hypothetical protein